MAQAPDSSLWYYYATLGGPWNSTRLAGPGPCPLPSRATCAAAEDYLVTFTSALAAQRPVIPGAGTSAPPPSANCDDTRQLRRADHEMEDLMATQDNWRFCTKCYSLFWYGNPTAGTCPAGAAHSPLESASPTHAATSVDFALQVASTSSAPLPFTKMSWGPSGTGPVPDSATVGSGGNECQFQVSLSIQQDGTCNFSGYYENRGDTWWGTAPPQAYVVAMIVFDAAGKGYTFAYSGEVPSAPQQGAVAQWDITQNCPVIAENWDSIAAKNSATDYWYNNYDESPWQVLSGWAGSALNWLQQNAGTIGEFVSIFVEASSGGAGSDTTQVVIPRAPLPAGVPAGTACAVPELAQWL